MNQTATKPEQQTEQRSLKISDFSTIFDLRTQKTDIIDPTSLPTEFKKAVAIVLLRSIVIDPRWICFHPDTTGNISVLASQVSEGMGDAFKMNLNTLLKNISSANSTFDMKRILENLLAGSESGISYGKIAAMVDDAVSSAIVSTTVSVVSESINVLVNSMVELVNEDSDLPPIP